MACDGKTGSSAKSSAEVPETLPISDQTSNPPRLMVMQNGWGLSGLPGLGKEWSFEEKIQRVKEAGFEGIQLGTKLVNDPEKLELLSKYGLSFSMGSVPKTVKEVRQALEVAKRTGAKFLIVIAGHSYMTDEEILPLVADSIRAASEIGVPLAWETHRGALTESPYRTLKLIGKLPQIRFCADLSHYAVAEELEDFGKHAQFWQLPARDILSLWGPLLERCTNIQCRISNGDSVQVDIGDGSSELAKQWVHLWTEIMRRWLQKARPGEIFPVAPELGPPVYSIQDLEGRELSDRWKQALVMKRLIEISWKEAHQAGGCLPPVSSSRAGLTMD